MELTPRFYFEGDDYFSGLRQAMESARSSIDIELYYLASDDIGRGFVDLLKRRKQEGVRVRVIYDSVGCRGTQEALFDEMIHAGIAMRHFNPWFPPSEHVGKRDHRKIFVIDGKIAFLGGFNLSNQFSGIDAWRDTGVRLEDQDLVETLAALFDDNWLGRFHRARDFIRRRVRRAEWGPGLRQIIANHGWRRKSLIREEYLSAIIRAKESIDITNPYFIPDHGIRSALRRAARRGVCVRLLTAGLSDVPIARWAGQATYASLLRSGVRIFEYQPRVLHAKSAVVDGIWYTVGTSNIDHLSFFRNLEVNLFGRDPESAILLRNQFEEDLRSAAEIRAEDWRRRPWWFRLRERFFFFFRVWL